MDMHYSDRKRMLTVRQPISSAEATLRSRARQPEARLTAERREGWVVAIRTASWMMIS